MNLSFSRALSAWAVLLGACISNSGDAVDTDAVIVWGDTTTGYPEVVPLSWSGSTLCTGTVVAPHLVLTAAHCVLEEGALDPPTVLGEHLDAASIFMHPRYLDEACSVDRRYDLALLKITAEQPGPFPVVPATLPDPSAAPTPIVVRKVGYGRQAIETADAFCEIEDAEIPTQGQECKFVRKVRERPGTMAFRTEWTLAFPGASATPAAPCPTTCTRSGFRAHLELNDDSDWQSFLDEHCHGEYMSYDGYREVPLSRTEKTTGVSVLAPLSYGTIETWGSVTRGGESHALGGGDSGGPMFIEGDPRQIIGVASAGYMYERNGGLGLADTHTPLHLARNLRWIRKVLRDQGLAWPALRAVRPVATK